MFALWLAQVSELLDFLISNFEILVQNFTETGLGSLYKFESAISSNKERARFESELYTSRCTWPAFSILICQAALLFTSDEDSIIPARAKNTRIRHTSSIDCFVRGVKYVEGAVVEGT